MGTEEAQGWGSKARFQAQLLTQQWSGVGDLFRTPGKGFFESIREKMTLLRDDRAQGVRSARLHPLPQHHLSPFICATVRGRSA